MYKIYRTAERGVNMCTRFVYNGDDTIVGFNFEIDLSVWTHTVITEKDRFFIGIKMLDNKYHSFHGVNKNGNVGTLLYVNGNDEAFDIVKNIKLYMPKMLPCRRCFQTGRGVC